MMRTSLHVFRFLLLLLVGQAAATAAEPGRTVIHHDFEDTGLPWKPSGAKTTLSADGIVGARPPALVSKTNAPAAGR